MNPILIYISAVNLEEANLITQSLLGEKLVACVNIIERINSFYLWEGNIANTHEVILLAKTFDSYSDRIIARTREIHSYDCPAIIAVPLTGGNPDYIAWMHHQLTTPLKVL